MKRLALSVIVLWLGSVVPLQAETIKTVKAAVFRSQGTMFLGMTIWPELNAYWSDFGDVPMEIDWWSLAGSNITDAKLEATGADVIVLSNPGFLTYSQDEISALRRYVEAGHGLIISYGKFRSEDRALAPLVGLSESISLGTHTANDPLQFDFLEPTHPLFTGFEAPYVSGVPVLANPYPGSWQYDGGVVLANLFTTVISAEPSIVAKETESYRGLYFAHYPEALSAGTNQQDMQLFYNGLVWAAAPEPATAILLLGGGLLVCRRRKTRS